VQHHHDHGSLETGRTLDGQIHRLWRFRLNPVTPPAERAVYTDDSTAIEHARANGINLHEADAELLAAVKDFARADLQTVSALFKDTYGVERSSEIAADFVPLLEKWNGLVADIDSNDALQQLFWNEVTSKVDPATYGQ
jgi:hypothetical protein